jgi:hypothetical protein
MYLDEHTVKDMPQLPVGHAFHYLEKALKSKEFGLGLNKKDLHDVEHEEQLIHWGCKPEHTSKLTIRKDENGEFFADRLYHIMLHMKYWKETADKQSEARMEITNRFEAESGFNLDDLTLPNPTAKGESAY